MGLGPSEKCKQSPVRGKFDMFEITNENGFVFCNKFIMPEEILALILSHIPPKELVFNCRRVCKYWCNIVDTLVWRLKLQRINIPPNKVHQLPWFNCFWIIEKKPLRRNLIKNNCGQEGLKHWEILSCGGCGWAIEKPPVGCDLFSENEELTQSASSILNYNSCFATSYYSCSKKQLIDLQKEGVYPELMDLLQPQITVTEWCCGRFDSGSIYDCKVTLLNTALETVTDFEIRKHLGSADGSSWQKVSYVFQNYGPGIRYIEFYHGGMDSQFWKGHYGSKMTGAEVILSV